MQSGAPPEESGLLGCFDHCTRPTNPARFPAVAMLPITQRSHRLVRSMPVAHLVLEDKNCQRDPTMKLPSKELLRRLGIGESIELSAAGRGSREISLRLGGKRNVETVSRQRPGFAVSVSALPSRSSGIIGESRTSMRTMMKTCSSASATRSRKTGCSNSIASVAGEAAASAKFSVRTVPNSSYCRGSWVSDRCWSSIF